MVGFFKTSPKKGRKGGPNEKFRKCDKTVTKTFVDLKFGMDVEKLK